MIKYYCDICNKEIKNYNTKNTFFLPEKIEYNNNAEQEFLIKKFHLCNSCIGSLYFSIEHLKIQEMNL